METSQSLEKERSSCEKVFALPELREAILTSIVDVHGERHGVRDLFPVMLVCRDFYDTIKGPTSVGRIMGFHQHTKPPSSCQVHPGGRCGLDPHHNMLLSFPWESQWVFGPLENALDTQKLTNAPSATLRLEQPSTGSEPVGHLEIGHFYDDCWWRNHSWSKLHFTKVPVTMTVTVEADKKFPHQRRKYNDGTDIIFDIRGGATVGQILDIANDLKKAAYWHIAGKIFRGDGLYYRAEEEGGYGKIDFAWYRKIDSAWYRKIDSAWRRKFNLAWYHNPHLNVYNSMMQWPWQRFVKHKDLLEFVVSQPVVKERSLSGGPSYRMMSENEEDIPEEHATTRSPDWLPWIGADLA
ncbi:hypothetical protein PRZ48_008790 [Zasmidium cellare]|uniref:Uncharacterized protein n=1 Tax=Zasmidium cellare TaxID=395010 RepID=A0ABR0EH91_ZASCE|nr:hypothetical protein PRZ48_008790 [Zasmidium cellare]